MTHVVAVPYEWRPVSFIGADPKDGARVAYRIGEVLYSWLDTPYMLGQRSKGQGVDCINFLIAVLDELYGFARPELIGLRLRGDRSLHNKIESERTKAAILSVYSPNCIVPSFQVEPGDIVITGPARGGPGHAMIVSDKPGVLVHATVRGGVQTAGCGYDRRTQRPLEVWRLLDKHRWLR